MVQDTASQGYATSDEEEAESEQQAAAAGSDDDIDMEDLGGRALSGKLASSSQAAPNIQDTAGPREMLTPALRANLGKQGYKLIGSFQLCVMVASVARGAVLRPIQTGSVHSGSITCA